MGPLGLLGCGLLQLGRVWGIGAAKIADVGQDWFC